MHDTLLQNRLILQKAISRDTDCSLKTGDISAEFEVCKSRKENTSRSGRQLVMFNLNTLTMLFLSRCWQLLGEKHLLEAHSFHWPRMTWEISCCKYMFGETSNPLVAEWFMETVLCSIFQQPSILLLCWRIISLSERGFQVFIINWTWSSPEWNTSEELLPKLDRRRFP